MSFFDHDPHKDDPPTSPFDLLDQPVTTDPGDGCGGYTLAELQERDLVRAALSGDEDSVMGCIELLFDHWQEKWRNKDWPYRHPWPAERRDVPSIAPVLLMLGLADPHIGSSGAGKAGQGISLKDWVLEEALPRIKGRFYERVDAEDGYRRWQKAGAPEGRRLNPSTDIAPRPFPLRSTR